MTNQTPGVRLHHGSWQARYRDPDGHQRTQHFDRKIEAVAFLEENKHRMKNGIWVDPDYLKQPLNDWMAEFQKSRGRKQPGTQEREGSSIKTHIAPALGNRAIGSIRPVDIQQWIDGLSDKGLKPGTVIREYGVLRLIFQKAVDSDRLVRTPCRAIDLPEPDQEGGADQRIFTAEEIERLYDAFDPRYKAMVLVGCYAGLRIGEQCALRKDHLLALPGQIDVQEGLFEPISGPLVVGRLKTRYSRGRVDIPQFLVEELAAHIQKYPGKDGLIFTSRDGEYVRPRNWRRRYWWPAVEAAGLDESCKPHAMRHSFVSTLIAEGLAAEKVCELARHRDPGFTWRVYRHQFERAAGTVSGAAEALEKVRKNARF